MPLLIATKGIGLQIKKISGNDETKRFLNGLGFIVGASITIVSEIGGNMIIQVKESRIALDRSMASRIIV